LSRPDKAVPDAVIYGCSGTSLTGAEREFFAANNPLGLIVFARNIEAPAQLRSLIEEFSEIVATSQPLVLIDQEGGRVARLGPPHWRKTMPAEIFGDLYRRDKEKGLEAARINAVIQGAELADIGITVNCTPVADLSWPETHEIIGDRAFGGEFEAVSALCRSVCEGHLESGVLPVIKHIPGHGRATADSHLELPCVDASLADLHKTDFAPFRALSDMPIAMTAHIVYSAIDPVQPATLSSTVISEIIRRTLNFDGLLLSDDLGMKALEGGFTDRAEQALAAGCDVVLHCSGVLEEMRDVAAGAGPLKGLSLERLEKALSIGSQKNHVDRSALADALNRLMQG